MEFQELVDGTVLNGFSLGVRLGSVGELLTHAVERHRSVFTRLIAFGHKEAEVEVKAARRGQRKFTPDAWIVGLRKRFDAIGALLIVGGAEKASINVVRALLDGAPQEVMVGLGCLLEHTDAAVTISPLGTGDRADILQTARRQAELLSRGKSREGDAAAGRIVELTQRFVEADSEREAGDDDYIKLLSDALQAIAELRQQGDAKAFEGSVTALRGAAESQDAARVDAAHRALLLHLGDVADG